jgi:hypothetical protein
VFISGSFLKQEPSRRTHAWGLPPEKEFGRAAIKEMLPMQPRDVPATYADIDDLTRDIGFKPVTKKSKME